MLDAYTNLAKTLYRVRAPLWGATALFVLTVIGLLLFYRGAHDDALLLGTLTCVLWSLSLIALAHAFVSPTPQVDPNDSFFHRGATRLKRGVRWLMAFAVTGLFVMILFFLARVLAIIF